MIIKGRGEIKILEDENSNLKLKLNGVLQEAKMVIF
jgi:hypothetical protein